MKLDRRRARPIKSLVVKQSKTSLPQLLFRKSTVSASARLPNLSSAIRVYVVEYYRFTALPL